MLDEKFLLHTLAKKFFLADLWSKNFLFNIFLTSVLNMTYLIYICQMCVCVCVCVCMWSMHGHTVGPTDLKLGTEDPLGPVKV